MEVGSVNLVGGVRVENDHVCDLANRDVTTVDIEDARRVVAHLLEHLHRSKITAEDKFRVG